MNKRLVSFLLVLIVSITSVCAQGSSYTRYIFSHMSETVKKLYAKYEESGSAVSVPKTAEDIVTVAECRRGSYEDRDVYLISYFMDGAVQTEPLVVEEDCVVSGIKSDMAAISCGDMIIIDTRYDETVDFIRVVMSLDDVDLNSDFKAQISVPDRAAWYLYGEQNNAKNEVYFGYIMKTKTEGGKMRVTMCDHTGKLDTSEIFNITADTRVTIYNAYKNDEKSRFDMGDMYDIEASIFPSAGGDVDFEAESFDGDEMRCAFIYVKRGEIKEIMLVNYSK